MIRLRGITWDHPRGYDPLVACARAFQGLHPAVTIEWSRRSLLEFGETPVEELARSFDLLVIDHPFIGFAARKRIFLPLGGLLGPEPPQEWEANTVGPSARSYRYAGEYWAAPIDTACPVAIWRPDLLAEEDRPRDWEQVMSLAAQGRVLIPGVHTDAIHHFYMLCLALGAEPGADAEEPVPGGVCRQALEELVRLYARVPEGCRGMNPIQVFEALAAADDRGPVYCPFAFGYSNYSRSGFRAKRLHAGDPPGWSGEVLRTTLGGTGMAVSAACGEREWASRFVGYVACGETQRGTYWRAGGQPAHRVAWLDGANDADADGFLSGTRPALERAWLRPRFPGYLHFQDHAAHVVHAAACGRATIAGSVERLGVLWREAQGVRREFES